MIVRFGEPYIEVRPHYTADTGPVLELWRVNGVEPTYLATLPLTLVGPLVRKLPIAVAAARRLRVRATQAVTNGGTEPN